MECDPQHTTCCNLVHLQHSMQPLNTSLHCTSLYPIAAAAAAKLLVTEGGSTLTMLSASQKPLLSSVAPAVCCPPQGRRWPSSFTEGGRSLCRCSQSSQGECHSNHCITSGAPDVHVLCCTGTAATGAVRHGGQPLAGGAAGGGEQRGHSALAGAARLQRHPRRRG